MTPTAFIPDLSPETLEALNQKYPGFSPQRIIEQDKIPSLDPAAFRETTTFVNGYEVIDGKPILLFQHGHSPKDLLGRAGEYAFLLRWTLMQLIIQMTGSSIFDALTWKALATIPLNSKTQPSIDEFNEHLIPLRR